MYNILTTVRWVLMALLYCGFSAIVVSVFTIEAKDGLPTPPISPALRYLPSKKRNLGFARRLRERGEGKRGKRKEGRRLKKARSAAKVG